MKLAPLLLLATALTLTAETEEKLVKRFAVQPGGTVVVDVDFGSIDVSTAAANEVVVDVLRRVTRASEAEEQEFLADRPVTITPEGDTVTISSRPQAPRKSSSSSGKQSTEAKYTITVPAKFNAQLKTAGGTVSASDLTGDVKAASNGGSLQFTRLHGALDGATAGGPIQVADCEGEQQVKTSGGKIDVTGGKGSFDGKTSGGPVSVKDFHGAVQVKTSGGKIVVDNVAGKVDGKTTGGGIEASFASPPSDEVNLFTSGGGVTLRVPENAAFDLDAATSGGNVNSDLAVESTGKPSRDHLKGPVNGGGKSIVLRTTGGSIRLQKQ
jgi:DUF4097 and DUF4098 domain-containing protein YvlB